MQIIKHIINLLVLIIVIHSFSQAKEIKFEADNTKLAPKSDYYLFAANLQTDQKKSPDEGILTNKHIRIINLGPIVNWSGLDYAPTVSADGKTLYFVSDRPGSKLRPDGTPSHDFWAAKKNDRLDTVFFKPFNIDTTTHLGDRGVNTQLNEGAASIAADGQTLYFTGCDRPDGLGFCDIYRTIIEGDQWGRPVNLGRNVNSKQWDSQPSISPDNKRLYFISNRPGPNGKDNFDIWYADWDEDLQEFQPAKNLEAINTPGREFSPFIAADGVTLFFASDGYKPNFGGLDFYVTRYDPTTDTWSQPQNLGTPINTPDDEQFITLPAAGDIIYFSSKRKDLPGFQGSFDVFMAFVPTFFRAINLIITVVDECSGENIPAAVEVKNPITKRIVRDTLTLKKSQFAVVVSNADYGNPKDSLKFVDFEFTATNPKYGTTKKIERINRPPTTQDIEETKVFASEIEIVLKLGQRPKIGSVIEEASYISRAKKDNPKLENYRGLVMEQIQTWDLYPLLNYVFFDLGSSQIPDRYILFDSPEETKNFTDTTIIGGTLDKYYHLLNIYGYRLNKYPDAKIEIVGCNDGTTPEEKRPGLSKERAERVYNYFKNIWKIDESRMKLTFRDKPLVVSNLKDSLGITENRRVEILCSDWEIVKPVFDKDPKTFPTPETMVFTLNNGIEDELVTARRVEIKRGNSMWKVLKNIGLRETQYLWDWKSEKNKYPTDEIPYTAQLIVTTTSGAECESDPITIPVMQVSTEKKKVDVTKDSTLERYSLILFPFDRADAGPINERIMRDYVYERCKPTSAIQVIGHTDIVGLYDHNMKLSERRATTVYNGIMKYTGGKIGSITSKGVGEEEPLYNNNLPEERFYNRTVQVIIRTPIEEYEK